MGSDDITDERLASFQRELDAMKKVNAALAEVSPERRSAVFRAAIEWLGYNPETGRPRG